MSKQPLSTATVVATVDALIEKRITWETGWDIHHIHFRGKGGTDLMSNLVMLHPNCHRQYHSLCGEDISEAEVAGSTLG